MRKLILGFLLMGLGYLSNGQSVNILTMSGGSMKGRGIADNVGEFVSLSAYTKGLHTRAILTCFDKSDHTELWSLTFSMTPYTPLALLPPLAVA